MRLLFVAPNIPVPGTHGGSTHVTEVVAALRRQHRVLLLARRGSSGEDVVGLGVGTAPGVLAYGLALGHLLPAYRHARAFAPDAIYERFSAHGLGVLLGRLLRVPVLSMVLDTNATRLTLGGANRLVTTAPHLIPERYHHKLVEVSWGANIERFRPDIDGSALRKKLGYGPEHFVIAYTGAYYPWHGLDTLVEAAGKLGAPEVRFLLVGDGQLRPAIEQRIAEAGLGDRFQAIGKVPYSSVPEHLAAADAAIAPYDPSRHPDLSRHGMFFDPLKVFEYLACAKPTITLDSANMRRMFENGEHALLVEPGNAEALRAAIERLLALPDRGKAMGQAGRRLVEQRYSWQAHADHLTSLFEELLERDR